MRHTSPVFATVVTIALLVGAAGAAGPDYTAYDLGAPGETSQIFGLNSAGAAVGSITTGGLTVAVYWPGIDAAPVILAGLGGSLTRAFDINSSGEIVGLGRDQDSILRAVYWPQFDQPAVQLQDTGSGRANAINDRGEIAGNVGNVFPVIWPSADAPPGMLATFGETGSTGDINNRGRIVGSLRSGGVSYPVYWDGLAAEAVLLGGSNPGAVANAINDRGHVVGRQPVGATTAAVFWQWLNAGPQASAYETPVALDSLVVGGASEAVDLNEAGEIVGWSGPAAGAQPTLWRVRTIRVAGGEPGIASEPPALLPSLGGSFARPQAVNNRGSVGGESAPTGETVPHATLWLTH
jgi:uncharacterized membrane protein